VEYIKIGSGSLFGLVDVLDCMIDIFELRPHLTPDLNNWYEHLNKFRRMFSVLCNDNQ